MPPLAIGVILISTLMHAGWNLIARDQRGSDILMRALLVISAVALLPTLAAEFWGASVLPLIWNYLLIAGVFQGLYFVGLSLGYRAGDFTLVYPLARGLPPVLVAIADGVRGYPPSAIAWVGIALVASGAILLPLNSLREFNLARYRSPALLWALLTAAATAGYSVTDSAAAAQLIPGASSALRYGVYEMFLSWAFYRLFLRMGRLPRSAGQTTSWPRIIVVGALLFGAYGLVLWAYQLSPHTSYVVALRQFSIVIGVIAGNLIFHETTSRLRLLAALIITLGGVCIALAH